jgi:hypothetical protein
MPPARLAMWRSKRLFMWRQLHRISSSRLLLDVDVSSSVLFTRRFEDPLLTELHSARVIREKDTDHV